MCVSIATTFFGLGFGVACVLLHEQQRRVAQHRFRSVIERQYELYESAEVAVARGELLREVMAEIMTGEKIRISHQKILRCATSDY
jgi:hypothetical protein